MARAEVCNVCDRPESFGPASESIDVRSNVRAFRSETFTVWRCSNCLSLHSRDDVDLPRYYASYPFQKQTRGFFWRAAAQNYVHRLIRAGLRTSDSVLDYGCGSGLLIDRLRARGFRDVQGYDAYSTTFHDRSVLTRPYDCVVMQDVIEHVDEPRALLDEAVRLTRPGGCICIGTPNAARLDLARPEDFVHSLHQPYHRHILSDGALAALAAERGLTSIRWYDTYYSDLAWPFANIRFGLRYAKMFDNTMDLAFEPVRFRAGLLSPKSLAIGLFGRLAPVRTEMMALFGTPREAVIKSGEAPVAKAEHWQASAAATGSA